ncbi:hypothetical protein A3715_03540 [Oleiphilus sp. HI0009]|uniref:hypothetical protein n=2 Tax=Oleiphilus TaxID=141450 RepID=UPI0007C37CA5|nr:hypothetical protein [Oleiphilus sp. HI0067]KZX75314.1 hypothetical protein A3715_22965 [Oleiphilus sp. HI0009]KZY65631.1 hypothetical protein A3738_08400 [Oleiphilus sp. HI0066]KZZ58859.1 hypothetical protein A3762_00690 [Oleiphilus sp. HI0125]KZX85998.1 hypothetical protein A3715_03540 [Oleiphilus sp. HI0009]KZY74193.1 hypothetical protein A3739_14885 [Oleiphilus sp. HI0067]
MTQALGLLMNELAGAVAVFHHARLDLAFLQKVARENYGCPLIFDYVDTMVIERTLMEKQGSAGAIQLEVCRDRYGLPKAYAHNALSDAIATAEFLCA